MDNEELRSICSSLAVEIFGDLRLQEPEVSEEIEKQVVDRIVRFAKEIECPHKTIKCTECESDTIVHKDEVHPPSFICGACGNY